MTRQQTIIAEILHTFYCRKKHSDDMSDTLDPPGNLCCYYLEQSIDPEWAQPDHQKWIEYARLFESITSGHDPVDVMQKIIVVRKTADELADINKLLLKYLWDLLEEVEHGKTRSIEKTDVSK